MTKIILGLIFLTAGEANALICQGQKCTFTGTQVNNHVLQEELDTLGYQVDPAAGISCVRNKCTIGFSKGVILNSAALIEISSAITNHVYVDLKERRKTRKDTARVAAQKLKEGTETQADMRLLVLYMLRLIGLGE